MNQPDAGVDTSGIETPDAWQGYTQDNYQYNYNDGRMITGMTEEILGTIHGMEGM